VRACTRACVRASQAQAQRHVAVWQPHWLAAPRVGACAAGMPASEERAQRSGKDPFCALAAALDAGRLDTPPQSSSCAQQPRETGSDVESRIRRLAQRYPDNIHLSTFDRKHYLSMSKDEQGVYCWCECSHGLAAMSQLQPCQLSSLSVPSTLPAAASVTGPSPVKVRVLTG
jgi:hypothetical protein